MNSVVDRPMSGPQMKKIAILVFGPADWALELAMVLGVNRRTIERAAKGMRPIPDGWKGEIKALLTDHVNHIVRAIESL